MLKFYHYLKNLIRLSVSHQSKKLDLLMSNIPDKLKSFQIYNKGFQSIMKKGYSIVLDVELEVMF